MSEGNIEISGVCVEYLEVELDAEYLERIVRWS